MKYGTFDQTGAVTGHYDNKIHKKMPARAKPMTDAEWRLSCAGRLKRNVATGEWVKIPPPAPPTEAEKRQQQAQDKLRGSVTREEMTDLLEALVAAGIALPESLTALLEEGRTFRQEAAL